MHTSILRSEVVDENLVDGTTGLVNWVQACVNGITLQDFATIRVTKYHAKKQEAPSRVFPALYSSADFC